MVLVTCGPSKAKGQIFRARTQSWLCLRWSASHHAESRSTYWWSEWFAAVDGATWLGDRVKVPWNHCNNRSTQPWAPWHRIFLCSWAWRAVRHIHIDTDQQTHRIWWRDQSSAVQHNCSTAIAMGWSITRTLAPVEAWPCTNVWQVQETRNKVSTGWV